MQVIYGSTSLNRGDISLDFRVRLKGESPRRRTASFLFDPFLFLFCFFGLFCPPSLVGQCPTAGCGRGRGAVGVEFSSRVIHGRVSGTRGAYRI